MSEQTAACRFTWDIIKRHRAARAVVLTTHSMEEADTLSGETSDMFNVSFAIGDWEGSQKIRRMCASTTSLCQDTHSTE